LWYVDGQWSHGSSPLSFWRSAVGHEPVWTWLNELPREDQRVIGRDIAKVQFGWPIGLPVELDLARRRLKELMG
jgi:hypothetical protein